VGPKDDAVWETEQEEGTAGLKGDAGWERRKEETSGLKDDAVQENACRGEMERELVTA
jgi:hypothetical protein